MALSGHIIDIVDGRFSGTSAADLAALFQKAETHPSGRNIVIHFHGGLVSRADAEESAADLVKTYEAAGAFPVFVVWNSDLRTTITQNLGQIAREKAFQRIVFQLGRFLLGKVLERAGARGPRVKLPSEKRMPRKLRDLERFLEKESTKQTSRIGTLHPGQKDQLQKLLEEDDALAVAEAQIVRGLQTPEEIQAEDEQRTRSRGRRAVRSSTKTLMSRSVVEQMHASRRRSTRAGLSLVLARYGVRIATAALKRYRKKRDHGLYTTIVEETLRLLYVDNIGGLVWTTIKQDTLDAFGPDPGVHAGTALVRHLGGLTSPDQRVTLVGHSTGAVFIGNLLTHADKVWPPAAKVDVVFMAAACTCGFLSDRLKVFRKRVGHIRNFGLSDELERGYWEVPAIYRGSLLYLVSGLLEEDETDMPLVGMERYFSGQKPYDGASVLAVRRYLAPECLWSVVDDGPGRVTAATRHGGFDREAKTKASQQHILSKGF